MGVHEARERFFISAWIVFCEGGLSGELLRMLMYNVAVLYVDNLTAGF